MFSAFEQVLTVDGASGSGKTSLLRGLSERFGCSAVELGPVVRTVAWFAQDHGLATADAVARLAQLERVGRLRIDRPTDQGMAASDVELDGRALSGSIFGRGLSSAVVAASLDDDAMSWVHGLVRETLRGRRAVLSAREAASRVCPSAGLRLRLEASPAVRERRKRHQLLEVGLRSEWVDDVRLLGSADSAHVVLDTTDLSAEQVCVHVSRMVEQRLGWTVRHPALAN